jgi:hypothetical protein
MTEAPAAPVDAGQAPGQGAQEQPWYSSYNLPDEDVGYIQNKKWDGKDGPVNLLKGYKELEAFRGVPADQLLKLPKDFNEKGALDPIYDRLGRPKTPTEYGEFKVDGAEIDGGRLSHFDTVFHGLGLNTAQRNALASATLEYETKVQADNQKAIDAAQEAQITALKGEWGNKFDERSELARRAVKAITPEGVDKGEFLTALEGAVGSANLLKMFANMADKANLGEALMNDTQERSFGYTPEQAKADIKALKDAISVDAKRLADFNNNIGPDVDKMKKLHLQAYPSK